MEDNSKSFRQCKQAHVHPLLCQPHRYVTGFTSQPRAFEDDGPGVGDTSWPCFRSRRSGHTEVGQDCFSIQPEDGGSVAIVSMTESWCTHH